MGRMCPERETARCQLWIVPGPPALAKDLNFVSFCSDPGDQGENHPAVTWMRWPALSPFLPGKWAGTHKSEVTSMLTAAWPWQSMLGHRAFYRSPNAN